MRASVRVPGTTSNLGPGFDALGMALELCNDLHVVVGAEETEARGLNIHVTGEGVGEIPTDADNLAYRSLAGFMRSQGAQPPEDLTLHLEVGVPLCGGLGGSATAIVGGAALGAAILGLDLDNDQTRALLLRWGTEMEGHPDNAAPCVLGGLVVATRDGAQTHTLRLDPPENLGLTLAMPELRQSTEELRAALPSSVAFADAVYNVGHIALLVGALCSGRLDLLGAAMRDRLHQDVRTAGIAAFEPVVRGAVAAGALSCVLSGAGSTVIATFDRKARDGEGIAAAMRTAFEAHDVPCQTRVICARRQGVIRI